MTTLVNVENSYSCVYRPICVLNDCITAAVMCACDMVCYQNVIDEITSRYVTNATAAAAALATSMST